MSESQGFRESGSKKHIDSESQIVSKVTTVTLLDDNSSNGLSVIHEILKSGTQGAKESRKYGLKESNGLQIILKMSHYHRFSQGGQNKVVHIIHISVIFCNLVFINCDKIPC